MTETEIRTIVDTQRAWFCTGATLRIRRLRAGNWARGVGTIRGRERDRAWVSIYLSSSKSPCVVERTANIPLAARRIVFGKFLNCGQTCVAPDYILCDQAVHDRLVEEIQKQIAVQFGRRQSRIGPSPAGPGHGSP